MIDDLFSVEVKEFIAMEKKRIKIYDKILSDIDSKDTITRNNIDLLRDQLDFNLTVNENNLRVLEHKIVANECPDMGTAHEKCCENITGDCVPCFFTSCIDEKCLISDLFWDCMLPKYWNSRYMDEILKNSKNKRKEWKNEEFLDFEDEED